MENILHKLIELDQKAKLIVMPMENELANLDSTIKLKSGEVLDEIDANINAKIAQMRADSKEYIHAKKTEIDDETNIQITKLEEEWDLNSNKWQDEVLSEVVSKTLKPENISIVTSPCNAILS